MSRILLIAEHDGSTLNPSTAKSIACAASISGAEIDVAVFASDGAAIAAEAAQLASVTKVLQVDNAANANTLAAVLAPQVAALAAGYSHVFGPSTTFGKDLMPRVAALLGVNQISDVMETVDSHTFKRPIYAGNAILTVEAPADFPIVITVRTASYQEVDGGNNAAVEAVSVEAAIPDHTRFVELKAGFDQSFDREAVPGSENFVVACRRFPFRAGLE